MISILVYHAVLLIQLSVACRNKTISLKELLQTFIVGSTMAVMANFVVQAVASRFMGSDLVLYTVGPVSEEIFKIAFVAFLLFRTPFSKTATIEDGILLGAAAGAGFGMTEDVVRAVGRGVDMMLQYFPGYDLSHLPQLITSWLPSERSFTSIMDGQFIGGHLLWTALVGLGVGFAIHFKEKKWRYAIPLVLLGWATIDHSLANHSTSWIGFLYPLYNYGMGLRYVFTALLIFAVVLDEQRINKNLPKDASLLLPGENKRSLFSEAKMIVLQMRFGWQHVKHLMTYFRLRRQLAISISNGENGEELRQTLNMQRKRVIGAVHFKNSPTTVSDGISRIWQGPQPVFAHMTLAQKIQILVIVIAGVAGLFTTWLFLFSAYLPRPLTQLILDSPLLPPLGILGYVVAVYQLVEYYRRKSWKSPTSPEDRVSLYSQPLLVHSSGASALMFVPSFLGSEHPLLKDSFFWGQFKSMWNELGAIRKWVGGTASAGIGFIPIVGNVKSGIDAAVGYDYIADEEVSGMDRIFAGIGAVPLLGNAMRGVRYGQKLSKFTNLKKSVEWLEDVDAVAGKIGFGTAVRDDMVNAYKGLRTELGRLSESQAREFADRRENMLHDWHKSGGLGSSGAGEYHLPVSGKTTRVFVGKEGYDKLGVHVNSDHVGQISIDEQNKSIMFDGITKEYKDGGQDLASVTKNLAEKFPEYTVMERHVMKDGFSVYDVTMPGGTKSQFYTVSTHSSGRVTSVSSR